MVSEPLIVSVICELLAPEVPLSAAGAILGAAAGLGGWLSPHDDGIGPSQVML